MHDQEKSTNLAGPFITEINFYYLVNLGLTTFKTKYL